MAYTFDYNFTLDLYFSTLLVSSCKNEIATVCVVFNLIYSWTIVENIVAQGGDFY